MRLAEKRFGIFGLAASSTSRRWRRDHRHSDLKPSGLTWRLKQAPAHHASHSKTFERRAWRAHNARAWHINEKQKGGEGKTSGIMVVSFAHISSVLHFLHFAHSRIKRHALRARARRRRAARAQQAFLVVWRELKKRHTSISYLFLLISSSIYEKEKEKKNFQRAARRHGTFRAW